MGQHWMAVWGAGTTYPKASETQYVKDVTYRLHMYMTVAGDKLRICFSNEKGKENATITRASVGLRDRKPEAKLDAKDLVPLTFGGGKESGVIPAGGQLYSDEIDFHFEAGEELSVSLYFGEYTKIETGHTNEGYYISKYYIEGDATATECPEFEQDGVCATYPFIRTIEALCDDKCYCIVAFGDSITAQSWPDRLSRRISALGRKDVAVIRRGIGGSRIRFEYANRQNRCYGEKGLTRFEKDIAVPGVKKVFILHGVNDIIHPDGTKLRPWSELPTAEDLSKGLTYYIETAKAKGLEVYLSEIMPFAGWRSYNAEREQIKQGANKWIASQTLSDGVLPFATAVADPADDTRLKTEFDSGDHLHPSNDGAQAMADSIPENLI